MNLKGNPHGRSTTGSGGRELESYCLTSRLVFWLGFSGSAGAAKRGRVQD